MGVVLKNLIGHVAFSPCGEETQVAIQNTQPSVIHMATIHDNYTADRERKLSGHIYFVDTPLGNGREHKKADIVIQHRMHFHRPLAATVSGPVEYFQTQRDNRGANR